MYVGCITLRGENGERARRREVAPAFMNDVICIKVSVSHCIHNNLENSFWGSSSYSFKHVRISSRPRTRTVCQHGENVGFIERYPVIHQIPKMLHYQPEAAECIHVHEDERKNINTTQDINLIQR